MNISEKRKTALYEAIAEPITQLRIENNAGFSIEEMDEQLFRLQHEIWRGVHKTLGIKSPA